MSSADLRSSLHEIGSQVLRDFVEEFPGHIEGQAAPYMERFPVCTDSHGVFKRTRSFGAPSPGGQGGHTDTDARQH